MIGPAAFDQSDRTRQRGAGTGAEVGGELVDIGGLRRGHVLLYNG